MNISCAPVNLEWSCFSVFTSNSAAERLVVRVAHRCYCWTASRRPWAEPMTTKCQASVRAVLPPLHSCNISSCIRTHSVPLYSEISVMCNNGQKHSGQYTYYSYSTNVRSYSFSSTVSTYLSVLIERNIGIQYFCTGHFYLECSLI